MAALGFMFDAAAHQALSNLSVALDLARAGISVFPCQPEGPDAKKPYPGLFWRNQSTTNELRIEQWWERWPDAMPGIDLAKTDFLVIDLDGELGHADWQEIAGARAWAAPQVETPKGGKHLWFRRDGRHHGNGRGSLPPKRDHQGIDVRGHGGYVIAPGATMLDGRRYEADGHDILSATSAPDWLWDILGAKTAHATTAPEPVTHAPRKVQAVQDGDARARAYGEAALDAERRRVAECASGGRNETLNRAAFSLGTLVGAGCLSEGDVRAVLLEAAQACGLVKEDGARACQATITSGITAGRSKPRTIPESGSYEIDATLGAEIAATLLAREVIEAADGTLHDMDGVIIEAPDPDIGELPRELANPPGLVGELANWICDTARRPQRSLAIGAALTILGTLCGRHIAGPTGSGTHLYVVGLAPTGAGKDHAMQQILTAMAGVEASHFIGPGQFISMPAVINFLVRAPLSVCAMDEFGSFMKRIGSRKASSFEGAISGILRTAWGSSFKPMPTPEWAGKASEVIMAPAMSIYGVSTAEEFYGALEGGDTSNGVLNRLLVVETRRRPKDAAPRLPSQELPDHLAEALKGVVNRAGPMVFSQLQIHDRAPPIHRVPWGPGAEKAFGDLVEEIHALCDGDAMAQAFFARVAETAVRIATILAVGIDHDRPMVTLEVFAWARGFAMWCARSLQRGGMEHIADSENQSVANAIRRAIREAGGRMKHRDLLRRLNHRVKNRDLIEVVKSLAEAEHITIEKVVPDRGGMPTVWYAIL